MIRRRQTVLSDGRIAQAVASFCEIYLGGIPPIITNDSAFLSFVTVLCGTEALASYRFPGLPNGERYVRFVEKYFPEDYRARAEQLWRFRNGMVHAFNTAGFALTHHHSELHLIEADDGLILNAEDFYAALLQASHAYFDDLEASPDLRQAFADSLAKEAGGAVTAIAEIKVGTVRATGGV